MLYQII